MTTNFQELKKTSASSLSKLAQELSKLSAKPNGNSNEDGRFWQPEVDKSGNGFAVIRFLPAPKGEDLPWVRIWNHGFQGPGGWYIENSLTTIGQPDPVSELNSRLWNSGNERDKETVRKQKRKLTYIANILVVKDTARPENEGKVFLYKFGKKIFDKLNSLMNPEFDDDKPVNPFDFWEGASLKLKIRTVDGYRNYDSSEFSRPAPVAESDAEIEKIWNQQHSLSTFMDPSNFKSYADLKARLDRVLGNAPVPGARDETRYDDSDFVSAPPKVGKTASASTDADDDLDFFRKLAEDE